jgi:lysophospholipase L1-like esterase
MVWRNMKRKRRKNKSEQFRIAVNGAFSLLLFFFLGSDVCAQPLVEFSYKTYGLEDIQNNVIQNAAHLDDFFESLYQQKIANDRKISIVHIGDSHIQADYLTMVVRRNFQTFFGNAGRGLIVPLRVAGTNEPPNFITRSDVKWIAKRCVHPNEPLPIGIGGITVNTNVAGAKLEIYLNDLWQDYTTRSLSLFFNKNASSFGFNVMDTLSNLLATIDPAQSPFENYSQAILKNPGKTFVIQTAKTNDQQNNATIFGVFLSNETNGVFYNAIGVNGAKYEDYNSAQYFSRQTVWLTPDVFIISLGTNEAINFPYLDKNLSVHIDRLISSLRKTNPTAKFILVTPPNAFRKKTKYNAGINIVRETILQYAVENGYAFYDMYKALGGERAADSWKAAGLIRPDGVHFTKEGYEHQGNLLFSALMKSYNEFVPLRHP